MAKREQNERRGWHILKSWGFWFWLIVWLPGHFKERKIVKENERHSKTCDHK